MPALALQTPGVYYEHGDANAPTISALRMDVPGFVGLARRGPIDVPVPVQSWRQFKAIFGGFMRAGFLAYAVRGFFENGGRRCWVVRVASREMAGGTASASTDLSLTSGGGGWRIAASSPGTWGDALSVTLRETREAEVLTLPATSTPAAAAVPSTSGFARYTLVRVSQDGGPPVFRVVAGVDPFEGSLFWVHPDAEARTPYDRPVTGFDPNRPLLIESVAYDLAVREVGRVVRRYARLSLVPEHARYGPRRLAGWRGLLPAQKEGLAPYLEPILIEERRVLPVFDLAPLDLAPDQWIPLRGGADGLALLQPYDFMGAEHSPEDSDVVKARKQRGFRVLADVSEVAAVALPDLHIQPAPPRLAQPLEPCVPNPCLLDETPLPETRTPVQVESLPVFSPGQVFSVQDALVQHCEERRDRIALLDPPAETALDVEQGEHALLAWRHRFDTDFAALYWPWLRVVDPVRRGAGTPLTRAIPPSGHVAGQIARTDLADGVHRAPANAPLEWVQDVTLAVGNAVHGSLNSEGVNVVRALPGRGLRLMGARTLYGEPPWHLLNVRRVLMMIAKALTLSTQWAAFEPNDTFTRSKLRLALTSFLLALWQQGALVGGTADAAFFVRCDEENNPPYERDRGRLLAEVGVAPSVPYEFVVVRVGRTGNEFEIREQTDRRT